MTVPTVPFSAVMTDPSTGLLQVTGLVLAHGNTYTGFIYKVAANSNGYFSNEINFSLVVNRLPTVSNAIGAQTRVPYSNIESLGGTCPWFVDSDGDTLTVNYTVTPTLPVMSIDSANCKFNFASMSNSHVGVYNVAVNAYDYASNSTNHGFFTFNLTITSNQGPQKTVTIPDQNFTAWKGGSYTLPANTFYEPEGETVIYSYTVTPANTFIIFNNDLTIMTVGAVDNSNVNTYTVTLTWSDGHPDTTNATSSFILNYVQNYGPVANTLVPNLIFSVRRSSTYTIPSTAFIDNDSEPIAITNTIAPSAPCLTFNSASETFTFNPAVANAGNYTLTLTASDGHPDTANGTQSVSDAAPCGLLV